MTRLLPGLLLLFCVATAHAQLPIFIKDEFNNNNNAWWIGNEPTYSMKIENGKYRITTLEEGHGRLVTLTPFMDKKKDFSIEATFVQVSGMDNNGFGLLWAGDGDRYQEFIVTTNGYYQVKSAEKLTTVNQWVETKKVKPMGEENTLKVEQQKGRWYYYLNGEELTSTDALPIYGNKIGIVNYTKMVLDIDNFIYRHDVKINLPENLPSGLVKENLGPNVNTAYDDLGPHITTDGRMIMFGRENSPDNTGGKEDGEDIWITMSKDGITWSKAKNAGSPINDADANNLAAISADNNMILFCKTDGFQVRKRDHDGWTEPEYLSIKFNNESGNMEGNLSPDGKAILFSSKLKQNLFYSSAEGNKEKDLYVAVQDVNGVWSSPINLGRKINTSGDEISPFMAADGRTLYFASNGKPGYGGYDIFMSKRNGDSWTDWSEPVNLGPEINTSGFDAYYTLSAAADYAYMVSDRNSHGLSDIVRIKLPEVIKPDPVVLLIGQTLNAKTKQPVSADILFEDLSVRKEIGEAISDPQTGSYRIALPNGKNYGIRAEAKGFLSVNENLELASITQYTEIQKDLYLVPIEIGESILLNNVFFEQGKPVLKSESYPELDRLVQIMIDNPSIKIEVGGHTDNVGNREALLALSESRVGAVKNYLGNKGIGLDRISGRGYGGSVPVVPNNNEANRQRNRRVEFKIVKK